MQWREHPLDPCDGAPCVMAARITPTMMKCTSRQNMTDPLMSFPMRCPSYLCTTRRLLLLWHTLGPMFGQKALGPG
eukprot:5490465-Amphidinium_carterae.1